MRPPDARISSYIALLPGGRRARIGIAILVSILAVAVLAGLQVGNGDSGRIQRTADDTPFYIEGTIVVFAAAKPGEQRVEESKTSLLWWYLRPGVWHWQMDIEPTDGDPLSVIGIADGQHAYLYKSETNTYTKTPVAKFTATNLPVTAILGPVDITQVLQSWEARDISVRQGADVNYMGRPTRVIEYSPTWRSSGSGGDRQGNTHLTVITFPAITIFGDGQLGDAPGNTTTVI